VSQRLRRQQEGAQRHSQAEDKTLAVRGFALDNFIILCLPARTFQMFRQSASWRALSFRRLPILVVLLAARDTELERLRKRCQAVRDRVAGMKS
jgi:hypothetical protein